MFIDLEEIGISFDCDDFARKVIGLININTTEEILVYNSTKYNKPYLVFAHLGPNAEKRIYFKTDEELKKAYQRLKDLLDGYILKPNKTNQPEADIMLANITASLAGESS